MATTLIFVRHGDYIKEDNGVLVDFGLSEMGQQQAILLSQRWQEEGFEADLLIASTMRRAQETAQIVSQSLDVPIIDDDDFQEWRNTDDYTSMDQFNERLSAAAPSRRVFTETYDGGETWSQFMLRVGGAIARVADDYAGRRIVIVAHGGVVEASFAYCAKFSTLHLPPIVVDAHHTSITEWQQRGDRWQLLRFNDIHHLRGMAFNEDN